LKDFTEAKKVPNTSLSAGFLKENYRTMCQPDGNGWPDL
jgi:hypothetical protein